MLSSSSLMHTRRASKGSTLQVFESPKTVWSYRGLARSAAAESCQRWIKGWVGIRRYALVSVAWTEVPSPQKPEARAVSNTGESNQPPGRTYVWRVWPVNEIHLQR